MEVPASANATPVDEARGWMEEGEEEEEGGGAAASALLAAPACPVKAELPSCARDTLSWYAFVCACDVPGRRRARVPPPPPTPPSSDGSEMSECVKKNA